MPWRPVPTALIIGSGPAAAGAALALTEGSGVQVTVIDIGHRLDEATQAVVRELSELAPKQWPDAELAAIARQPVPSGRALPEKRSYGSDFPFRDVGQLGGITAAPKVNSSVVSAAYGASATSGDPNSSPTVGPLWPAGRFPSTIWPLIMSPSSGPYRSQVRRTTLPSSSRS